jgi:hypothetical protein
VPGQSAMMLKSNDEQFNFGTFTKDGFFKNYGIGSNTENVGHPEIGEQYLDRLTSIYKDTYVHKAKRRFNWTIKKKDNQYLPLSEFLTKQDEFLLTVQEILDTLNKYLGLD